MAPLYWPREKSFDQSVVLQQLNLRCIRLKTNCSKSAVAQPWSNPIILNAKRWKIFFDSLNSQIAKEFCSTLCFAYTLGLLALSSQKNIENWRFWKMTFFWVSHFDFFFQKKKKFCFILLKISHKLCVEWMGLKFYDYDGLQPKISPPKHYSQQCINF